MQIRRRGPRGLRIEPYVDGHIELPGGRVRLDVVVPRPVHHLNGGGGQEVSYV